MLGIQARHSFGTPRCHPHERLDGVQVLSPPEQLGGGGDSPDSSEKKPRRREGERGAGARLRLEDYLVSPTPVLPRLRPAALLPFKSPASCTSFGDLAGSSRLQSRTQPGGVAQRHNARSWGQAAPDAQGSLSSLRHPDHSWIRAPLGSAAVTKNLVSAAGLS